MRKTTFLMKCALVLLASCFFTLDSSYAQGSYCGNAVAASLNSNWQSLCADQSGTNPRHFRYTPSSNGSLELCGTIAIVSRGCVNGTATNQDNGVVFGSCNRGNMKRYALFAGQPIYIKVVAGFAGSCVDARVVVLNDTDISTLCTEGTEVSCGQTISGDNYSGGNDFQTSDYSCYGGSSDFSGNDVVYKIQVPANQNAATFRLQPLQKDIDLFIYRCINGTPVCITRSLNGGTSPETINISNAQGKTYYAIIDGYNASQQSTYTFTVSGCGTSAPAFPCEGIPIECGDSVSSNNFNSENNSQQPNYANCFGGSATFPGNDVIYEMNLTEPTNLSISLTGLSADLDLFLMRCDASGTPTCLGASVNGDTANDQINVNNASGQFFIVVESQFETSTSNFNLSVTSDACVGATEEDCAGLDFDYVAPLRYTFSVDDSYPFGNWIAIGGPFTSPTGGAIGSGLSTTYTFPEAGVYDICYKYVEDGQIKQCCKSLEVVANPYDCNDIFYAFNTATNRYEFNIPGISNENVLRWQDDDNGAAIGANAVVTIPVGEACQVRNFSVIFLDPAVGYYRVCCISIYLCDPYNCDAVAYEYDANSSSYVLSIPGVSEATWYDDDNGTGLGTSSSINISPDADCRVRNFSARFYDPGVNAYRICCISLYVCDPYNCDNIENVYNPAGNNWGLTLPGVADADVLYWQNDATGQQIAGATSSTVAANASAGTCVPYSVLFFDAATESYRVCCLEICLDEDGCTGTPSDNECSGTTVVESTPVCGCDGTFYESECDALAAGVQSWTVGPCVDPIDPDCDALTFDYAAPLRYRFGVEGLPAGAWRATGGPFTTATGIGAGSNITYTFPQAGVYEVCFVYVDSGNSFISGTVRQCCKTIEVVADPYDCNDITYGYNSDARAYELNIPGIGDEDVLRWQDDDTGATIGTTSSVSVTTDGRCGIRNFSVLFYDAAVGYYSVCCISLYVCDPYDCAAIQNVYNPSSNNWTLSLPGVGNADILYWQNDATGQQIAGATGNTNVSNPSAGTCTPYSVLFFDAATQSYRVCCLELCLDANGCTGTPSDNECSGGGVVEETPVCGCDDVTYDSECDALAAGVQSWTEGPCTGPTDDNCDGITFEFVGAFRYTFKIDNSYPFGNWIAIGGPFTSPTGSVIGSGSSTTYTFPEAGVYEICYKYVEDAVIKQCCKTINVVADPYDCNDIAYGYNTSTRAYELNLPGITNANVLRWQDDDTGATIGTTNSVSIATDGRCGIRNFSVLFYDAAVGYYSVCCISLYVCDPYDCASIQNIYNPSSNNWTLSLPGVGNADILYWQNDATGQQIAGATGTTNVSNPSAGTCTPYSVLFFDAATQSYRVCCLELCLNDDGCTGTPSDNECSGGTVVEETPVCGCDDVTYDSECDALAAGVQSWTEGPCTGPTDDNCDGITFEFVGTLRYTFKINESYPFGNWIAIGGPFTSPTGSGIGSGSSTTYTFPEAGVYEVCYKYVEDGLIKQCCKTIEVAADPYDCNSISYAYNSTTSEFELSLSGISDADVLRWQDDNSGATIGTTSTVTVAPNGSCGIRNFSVLFYDAAAGYYSVCCISLYVCDPYDCAAIQQTYNAGTNTIGLSLPGVAASDILYWQNDGTGQQIAGATSSVTVNNPTTGNCIAVSVLFFDTATQSYRVCCLEICNDAPPACAVISDATFTCKADGSVDYSFTLNNNSGQTVDAEFIMLSPIGVTFANCNLTETITNIGSSRNITLNIDNCLVPVSGGDAITFKIVLREAGKAEGWCCHVDPTTVTIPADCGGTSTPTCTDGVQNGNETGVDCGGSCPTACATCDDGIQNGDETGIDCGGSCPTACPTCTDGVQNGDETGVDCGGANCPDCVSDCTDDTKLNLVRNGGFEGGNWAFTSGYTDGCYCGENTYCIRTNARDKCNSWDNITGTGKYLMVDAGRNSPDVVWAQDVNVRAGVEYTFCFDMYRNLTRGSSPVLRMLVDEDMLGGAAPGRNNQWLTYSRTWTATTSGTVSLSIQLVSAAGGTDDFGIDNIGMKYCPSNVAPEVDEALTVKGSSDIVLSAAPNPFTDVTTISFTLSSDMPATVSVFNMDGKKVFEQFGDFYEGINTMDFRADASLSAGIYYYRLETAEQAVTKSMILMKR